MKTTGEDYPCGPCYLPLECSNCGTIITEENVVEEECNYGCEICDYWEADKMDFGTVITTNSPNNETFTIDMSKKKD